MATVQATRVTPRPSSLLLSWAVLLLLLSPTELWAAPPPGITYQGLLTRSDGTIVQDGTYQIEFTIWDLVAGGSPQFSRTLNVSTSGGLYNVVLTDAGTGEIASAFSSGANRYVQIKILNGPGITSAVTLLPRQQILSVPYSFVSASATDAAHATLSDRALTADALTTPPSPPVVGAWRKVFEAPIAAPEVNVTGLDGARDHTYKIIFQGRMVAGGIQRWIMLRFNSNSTAGEYSSLCFRNGDSTAHTDATGITLGYNDSTPSLDADVIFELTLSAEVGFSRVTTSQSTFRMIPNVAAGPRVYTFECHAEWSDTTTPITALWLGADPLSGATLNGRITVLALGN